MHPPGRRPARWTWRDGARRRGARIGLDALLEQKHTRQKRHVVGDRARRRRAGGPAVAILLVLIRNDMRRRAGALSTGRQAGSSRGAPGTAQGRLFGRWLGENHRQAVGRGTSFLPFCVSVSPPRELLDPCLLFARLDARRRRRASLPVLHRRFSSSHIRAAALPSSHVSFFSEADLDDWTRRTSRGNRICLA